MGRDRLGGKRTLKVNGFLEEFEKDEVKGKVDIVELFESFGVKLREKGKSFIGLCPWHDDHTPSLSANREKGLYHCFGCGESGDVVDLVEKMKGVGFREALEYLREWVGKVKDPVSLHSSRQCEESEDSTKPISSPSPIPQAPRVSQLSLNIISEYYHKQLYRNPEALGYLKKRGLDQAEVYKRFGIGYADGSLLARISNGQKEELKALGIIRENGKEHLYHCITVPLHDGGGKEVGLYGRIIDENGSVKHLYLKEKHRGLFNRGASKVYDEIVLTESILDALSLIIRGIENVQALYGVNGFTEEHLKTLRDDRVKRIILALDNDEAGRKASEELTKKFQREGFEVKRIFPRAKDWNEELLTHLEAEEVKAQIEEAEEVKPEGEEEQLRVKKDGPAYWLSMGEISYRVIGVKEVFVMNLKVKVKAEHREERFYDTVDLYSSRGRESFGVKAGSMFGVEPKRIEKDLVRILEYLEEERDEQLKERGRGEEKEGMSEEERESGMELLESGDLFERIEEDMSILGYVAEGVNKLIVYLAAISRFLPTPLNVYLQSVSSGGKSALLSTLERMIPPEDVIKALTMSHQALHYVEEEEFIDKVFIMGEDIHDEGIEGLVRQMQSEGEISRLVTVKDEKSGEMRARLIRKEAKMSFMVTSTALSLNAENASRCLVLYADESAGQTKKVQERLGRAHSWEGQVEEESEAREVEKRHRAAQRLLQKVKIFNPLWKYLRFPTRRPSMRRTYDQFLTLIDAICFLRQKQKEEVKRVNPLTGEEVRGIECDLEDYRIGYRLFTEGVLRHGAYDLSTGTRRLYESIREMVREGAEREGVKVREVSFIQKQVREYTQLGVEYVKKHLRELVEYEYVEVQGGRRHGTRYSYRLREDKGIEEMDISEIPRPEEVEEKIQRESEKTGYGEKSGDN